MSMWHRDVHDSCVVQYPWCCTCASPAFPAAGVASPISQSPLAASHSRCCCAWSQPPVPQTPSTTPSVHVRLAPVQQHTPPSSLHVNPLAPQPPVYTLSLSPNSRPFQLFRSPCFRIPPLDVATRSPLPAPRCTCTALHLSTSLSSLPPPPRLSRLRSLSSRRGGARHAWPTRLASAPTPPSV